MSELTPERSYVDRELQLLLSGVRVVLGVLAVALVVAVMLVARLPHGPHPYGDGACKVTGNVGECVIP
jgi:hypothetical protein